MYPQIFHTESKQLFVFCPSTFVIPEFDCSGKNRLRNLLRHRVTNKINQGATKGIFGLRCRKSPGKPETETTKQKTLTARTVFDKVGQFLTINFASTDQSSQRSSMSKIFESVKSKLEPWQAEKNWKTEFRSTVESMTMSLGPEPSTSSSRYLRDFLANNRSENGMDSLS